MSIQMIIQNIQIIEYFLVVYYMTEEVQSKPKKEDKRKQTSKNNAAKARQTKLDKLKKQKEDEEKYQFEDSSDDSSDSDDEVIVVKPRKKSDLVKKVITKDVNPQSTPNDPMKQEIVEMKELLKALTMKKQKKKSAGKRSKQVIKIVNPAPQQQQPNKELDSLKQRFMLNF
jgi:hypothetical protein